MAQLRFLYYIFCQELIDLPNSNDYNAFYILQKNGGTKIRDTNIFANFIFFFNRSGWGKIWFGSVQNEGLRKKDTKKKEKKYKNRFF